MQIEFEKTRKKWYNDNRFTNMCKFEETTKFWITKLGGTTMIDTKNYILLENEGYVNKVDAYNQIRLWYTHMNGVTTYYDDSKWYIVQSKALM